MRIGVLLLGLALLVGCGDSDAAWDERARRLAESLCRFDSQCQGSSVDPARCSDNIVIRLTEVKERLVDEGEERCMLCMRTQIEELEKVNESSCREEVNSVRIEAACNYGGMACPGF